MADKINAAGYETKPWWPYVRELMEGGGSVTVEQLNVTENGTYTAEAGKAYSPVVVNVPSESSDFIAAEVTIVNNSKGVFTLMPTTLEMDSKLLGFRWSANGVDSKQEYQYNQNTETTDKFYIFNGDYMFGYNQTLADAASYTVTGNAEVTVVDNMPLVKITGDCTITMQ